MRIPAPLACALLFASGLTAADAKRPNVLMIAIDDLRDWVGHLHHNEQTKTPNIDRLAAMGTAFRRSYCAAPVCNPSRAALMSGMRPSTTGVYENNNDWRTVIPEPLTLTHAFKQAGYVAIGCGKIYHGSYRRLSDWDHYLEDEGGLPKVPAGHSDGVGGIKFAPLDCKDEDLNDWKITNYGIEQLGKPHDKPFFLAVGLHKPHMPWNVPRKYYDMFPIEGIQLPPHLKGDLADVPPSGVKMAKPGGDHADIVKADKWKEAVQGYLAAIAYTDMNIGRLLDAFDKSAYKDNTIICFWCDHGWHLGEKDHWRKFALWEEATRAPLIFVAPGVTKPGAFCDRTVDFMSIYPTLCDLCGIDIPKHVDGRSIVSLLRDPKSGWDQPALTTHLFQNHAVRSEGWRLIHYENGDQELYNESDDPNEWTNLAMKPEYKEKIDELARHLPMSNHADIGGARGKGVRDAGTGKKAKKKPKKAAKNAAGAG